MANAWGASPEALSQDEDEVVTGELPRPLTREIAPATPFPVEALGKVLGNAAKAIQDRTQAPMAIGAQSVLATAALAVQGHANVLLPTRQKRPLSLYMITIAESGERKTSCDLEATWPIERYEERLREEHDAEK
jgi:Protein of unknown function (DUF3987)